MVIKIYCDNGACTSELTRLKKEGCVDLFMFKYENKNRHVSSGLPSKATHKDLKNYTFNDLKELCYADFHGSEKYGEIASVVGLENRVDVLHLDSAYKNKCHIFVTNDKDDIGSKRDQLERLLNMRIFCVNEMESCVSYIEEILNN